MRKLLLVALVPAFLAALALVSAGYSSATQNCLGWDLSTRAIADGPAAAPVKPVLDRLTPGQPYGPLLREWLADNCMRLNHVQMLGTHNSYHIQPRPSIHEALAEFDPLVAMALEYTHRPLDEQLDLLGLRHFELDIFADPEGGLFAVPLGPIIVQGFPDPIKAELLEPGHKVLHVQDIDFETTCLTLVSCLQIIKAWSDGNPGHLPVMVLVEAKDDPITIGPPLPWTEPVPFSTEELSRIDDEIRSVFPDHQLITPDDVRGNRTTLEEAILKDGWPTLNESRGRILFAFDNTDAKRDLYIAGHPSLQGRVMFTSSPPGAPESAFVKMNQPLGNEQAIRDLVTAGYIVRTRADADTLEARLGITQRRDAALASGAQFVSTDYPEPNPDFGTSYFVEIADGLNARCNPVLSPPSCDPLTLEH